MDAREEVKGHRPLIFATSKRKCWMVREALLDNAWVDKIGTSIGLTMEHIVEFMDLWVHLDRIQLRDDAEDDITWKLTMNGEYSA